MKMKTNKKLKRAYSMALLVLLSVLIFALPCLAWEYPPIYPPYDEQYDFWFSYNGNIVAYGMSVDGVNYSIAMDFISIGESEPGDWFYTGVGQNHPGVQSATQMATTYLNNVKSGFVQELDLTPFKQHIINTTLEDLRFTIYYLSSSEIGQEIVSEAIPSFNYNDQLAAINNATTIQSLFALDSSYSTALTLLSTACFDYIMANGTYQDGYNVGYTLGYEQGYLAGESSNNAYQSGYNTGYGVGLDEGYSNGYTNGYNTGYEQGDSNGYTNGYDIGYDDGFDDGYFDGNADGLNTGYNTGYTDGATDSGYMKNTLITIFSSPYYILNEVFNFEIFGVSVVGIIMFVISIIIVGFVIKTII